MYKSIKIIPKIQNFFPHVNYVQGRRFRFDQSMRAFKISINSNEYTVVATGEGGGFFDVLLPDGEYMVVKGNAYIIRMSFESLVHEDFKEIVDWCLDNLYFY